ncbi:hypothetical protein [Paracoccus sp. ME4]|uniref:hypothetical protein n=1 Tax=Paracoccus sp. ME4 TaxID=3138066 RepID=UPI00398A7F7F
MTGKIAMHTSGKLRFPKDRARRERRPIPGLDGYSISQTGLVAAPSGELEDPSRWPLHDILLEEAEIVINVVNAVAHAWLDEAAQARIRSALPPTSAPGDIAVQELEGELQVSRHAIVAVARHPEGLPAAVSIQEPPQGEAGRITLRPVENYTTFLAEPGRAPSKGGNTRALHSHRLTIDGQHYGFLALGKGKWVYAADVVSFNYVLTPGGYRNIIKHSLRAFDRNGKAVVRGDRGTKPTLRTAPARLPGSRRERMG